MGNVFKWGRGNVKKSNRQLTKTSVIAFPDRVDWAPGRREVKEGKEDKKCRRLAVTDKTVSEGEGGGKGTPELFMEINSWKRD